MRIVGFGTYDARTHPRVGILLDGLRAAGHQVLEINVPLGLDTATRVALLRQPHRLGVLALRIARCWLQLIRLARRMLAGAPPDVVVVGYLGHFDVLLARRLFPGTPIVLDHLISAADTARDRGSTGSLLGGALRRLDRAAVRAADVVVVDTEESAALLPAPYADRALVLPVGAPASWWAARRPRSAPRPPERPLSVVFFGLFTPLQGAPVVGAALAALPADVPLTVIMIGTGQDYAATRAAAEASRIRIEWRDWVEPAALPAVVAAADVCLGIFGTSAKARRVVSNKVFQGAAAGCAIVTSDTPPQRRILGDAAVFVPLGDPAALAAALRRLACDPTHLARHQAAAAGLADASFRPETVVRPLLERLPALAGAPR